MAGFKWKKKKRRRTTRIEVPYEEEEEIRPDIFSTLPDYVLTSILPFLTLKEAARTTLLSKGWRHHFHNIPHLVAIDVEKWPEVFKTILRYRGTAIQSFKMAIRILESFDGDLDEFLDGLCKNNPIKELVLHNLNDDHLYPILSIVFSSNSLVTLNLEQLKLNVPKSFDGLRSLKYLRLKWVFVTNKQFASLASGCRSLEELVLHHCPIYFVDLCFFPRLWSLEVYTITKLFKVMESSQLKKVNLVFCYDPNEIRWMASEDAPEVEDLNDILSIGGGNEAEMELNDVNFGGVGNEADYGWFPDIVDVFKEFRNVEVLAVRIREYIAEELGEVPERLSDGFTVNLKLVSVLSCLVKSWPQLPELVVVDKKFSMALDLLAETDSSIL